MSDLFLELRCRLWPLVKTRLIYWWWIVKYGGKKNIPPEVLFKKMEETVAALADDLAKAQQTIPLEEMGEEERLQLRDLRMRVGEFQGQIRDLPER